MSKYTILEKWSSIVAFFVSLSFLLCIIHELSFFWIIGPNWRSFLEITDYFNIASQWLPMAVIINSISIYQWTPIFKIDDQNHEIAKDYLQMSLEELQAEIEENKKQIIKLTRQLAILGVVVFTIFASLEIILFLLFGAKMTVAIGEGLLIAILAFWLYKTRKKRSETANKKAGYILKTLFALALVSNYGMLDAALLLHSKKSEYLISTVNGDTSEKNIIRKLQNGLLLLNPINKKIEFLRIDTIASITETKSRKIDPPPICNFHLHGKLKVLCNPDREIPNKE